jgi:hypothetical protein
VASDDAAAASVAFEQAAAVRPSLRPECLWLAAVHEPAKDAAAQRRRIDLLLRQRESDPLGPYAGRVATWLSQLDGFPSDAVATAVLLEVPDRDALFAAARAEAARRILRAGAEDAAAQTRSAERALRVTDACAASPLVARWRLLAATTPGAQDLGVRGLRGFLAGATIASGTTAFSATTTVAATTAGARSTVTSLNSSVGLASSATAGGVSTLEGAGVTTSSVRKKNQYSKPAKTTRAIMISILRIPL